MGTISRWDKFIHSFEPGSSDIDWCEPNYLVSSHVTEFYNTITNTLFIILPPIMMYLFRSYSRYVSASCHVVWLLLMLVGVGSAYFHGTLSLAGQLMDELAILWVIAAVAALWLPKYVLPPYLVKNSGVFKCIVFALTVLFTWLGFLYPVVNNIVLMSSGIPTVIIIYREAKSSREETVQRLGTRGCILWVFAALSWVSDRTMCRFWLWIRFPYLHAIWHTIIVFATSDAILFAAYKDTEYQYKKLRPQLYFWPSNRAIFGIPYMTFKSALPMTRDKNANKVS